MTCLLCVCLQELANRFAAGEEAIYEGLPDMAGAAPPSMTSANSSVLNGIVPSPAAQLLQVDPCQALKQLSSIWAAAAAGM
jgi:hypothetical protein